MKLAANLWEIAAANGVVVTEELGDLVFRGTGTERRLSIERLKSFSDDGLNYIARWNVLSAIRYANRWRPGIDPMVAATKLSNDNVAG